MVDVSIQTGSRFRLPVFVVTLLCCAFPACSGEEPSDNKPDLQARGASDGEQANPWGADPNGGTDLWDTPPLPNPISITIAGEAVADEIGLAYFLARWSEYCAEEGFGLGAEKLTEGFLADPQALISPFVRGVILLREAESRFPVLDQKHLNNYRTQMEMAAGSSVDALKKRYGVDGWERHVERQFRLRMLKAEFATLAEEITEEDVYALYDADVLAKLPSLDPAVGEDVSFEALESRLRARLEVERANEVQEQWIDEQMEGLEVKVELPGGRVEQWTESGTTSD